MFPPMQVHDLTGKLVEPIKILLVIGIASVCAQATWLIALGPIVDLDGHAGLATAANAAAPSVSPRLAGDEIAELHLFGETSTAEAMPQLPESAPETRLRLELEGIFMSDDPRLSVAIIAEQNKPGEPYHVGDRVTPTVELAAVRQDRVILKRGTKFETLSFSEDDTPGIEATAAPSRPRTTPRNRLGRAQRLQQSRDAEPAVTDAAPGAGIPRGITSVSDFVDVYRSRLDQDPRGTLRSLGIEPVAAAGSEGYRLSNVDANPYLSQAGLQPGDVIVSVNGRPVGDVQADRRQIDNIIATGSARIEIVRGSRRFFVTASLR